MLTTLLLASMLAGPAPKSTPQNSPRGDVFFAYFVRTTVSRVQKAPSGPIPGSFVVVQGPMTFNQGLETSRYNNEHGVCIIDVEPTNDTPGHSVCYPAHMVQKVEVVSPPPD